MSICPKNKSSKARRDSRRANWKMSAPNLVKCSKCGALMMPHRVCMFYCTYSAQICQCGIMSYIHSAAFLFVRTMLYSTQQIGICGGE